MNYAPHTLYVLKPDETRDEYNRVSASGGEWRCVGECRCDDNSDTILSPVNSREYVPRYHIVCHRTCMVSNGDRVRVLDAHGNVRGEGKADKVRVLNYLDYTDFYAGL